MRFSKAVVKYRVAILIVALALLAPAVLGMVNTRINYDMLNYLPEDMDTVIGQNELLERLRQGRVLAGDRGGYAREGRGGAEGEDRSRWSTWTACCGTTALPTCAMPMELLPDSLYDEIQHGERHA